MKNNKYLIFLSVDDARLIEQHLEAHKDESEKRKDLFIRFQKQVLMNEKVAAESYEEKVSG